MEPERGSFRRSLRARLLDGMIRKVKPTGNGWKVLVVDREALRILAAAVELSELVNEGVTIVEMIDLRREPLPRLPAIYFITPSAESVNYFASEQKTQYKEYHLFFTGRLPDYQMNVIRQNAPLLRRVKSLVELNISFLASESRVFSLDRPAASLPQLFGSENGLHDRDAVAEMSLVSERLTDACTLVTGKTPLTVRCDGTSHVSRRVASLVKEQLETLRIGAMSRPPMQEDEGHNVNDDRPKKATLIVLDRATDVISPLMHEFTYQPMLHDLLRLDYRKPGGAHYEVGEENGKPKHLPIDDEDKDPVWEHIRHEFIEIAHDRAEKSLRHFMESDAAYKLRGKDKGDVNISEMTAAVRSLPESQMRADRHAMHVSAVRECLKLCGDMKLTEISLVEQDIALGRQADGTRVSSRQIMDTLRETLADKVIPVEHRVRTLLIALAIAAEDNVWMNGEASLLVTSQAFKEKMSESGLDEIPMLTSDMRAAVEGLRTVLNFTKKSSKPDGSALPDTLSAQMTGKLRNKMKERRAYKQHEKRTRSRRARHRLDNTDEVPYDVARYTPPVRGILADLVSDRLDEAMFPTTGAVSVNDIIADVLKQPEAVPKLEQSDSETRPILKRAAATSQALSGAMRAMKKGYSDESSDGDYAPSDADPDHLYIVFFVGGLCHSEIRVVYEVCKKRRANIIVGGSHILTPTMFLSALGGISDPLLRIRVLLPPLPLDLAQIRAAKEKTLLELKNMEAKENREKKRVAGERRAKRTNTAPRSSASSLGTSLPKESADAYDDYDRPADDEVTVVDNYKTPSRMRKWFGKKH